MNAEFFTHDHPHLMSCYATLPITLFLRSLAALQIRAIASYGCGLRLARELKNSVLGCVQLPFLGSVKTCSRFLNACRNQISLCKIIALEKQRNRLSFGQSVAKYIPKI
jgi:hypothetical protein